MTPRIIAIAGTASNVGKTTLLCRLLREFSRDKACEAIKLTRGHYRSCGKDPHACCVSDLLGEEATVRSGRSETYTAGKDTARYWDDGASNVHWVIATNDQVEKGVKLALDRVQSPNVLIEGTSFLKFIRADFAVLVVGPDTSRLKPSARHALLNGLIDAVYLSSAGDHNAPELTGGALPIYTHRDLPQLIDRIKSSF